MKAIRFALSAVAMALLFWAIPDGVSARGRPAIGLVAAAVAVLVASPEVFISLAVAGAILKAIASAF